MLHSCFVVLGDFVECSYLVSVFFFKQKTAYEMRISDWSSDVCSSDLRLGRPRLHLDEAHPAIARDRQPLVIAETRDLLAGKLERLQHGGASGHLALDAINFELGHCGAVLDNPRPSGWTGSAGARKSVV